MKDKSESEIFDREEISEIITSYRNILRSRDPDVLSLLNKPLLDNLYGTRLNSSLLQPSLLNEEPTREDFECIEKYAKKLSDTLSKYYSSLLDNLEEQDKKLVQKLILLINKLSKAAGVNNSSNKSFDLGLVLFSIYFRESVDQPSKCRIMHYSELFIARIQKNDFLEKVKKVNDDMVETDMFFCLGILFLLVSVVASVFIGLHVGEVFAVHFFCFAAQNFIVSLVLILIKCNRAACELPSPVWPALNSLITEAGFQFKEDVNQNGKYILTNTNVVNKLEELKNHMNAAVTNIVSDEEVMLNNSLKG